MIARFFKIQRELTGIIELLSLLPNHLEVAVLSKAFVSLKKFNSVTIMLQHDGMTFVESREIFDLFLKDHPDFEHYIASDALIVENGTFETAVMQISRGVTLSENQRRAALPLLRPTDEETPTNEDDVADDDILNQHDLSYSEELQRKRKRQKRVAATERPDVYVNLDMLPGTSVNCERLFSQAKFILSDTRKRTNPTLFEALLLLKINASYWNVFSVSQAMGRSNRTAHHADGTNTSMCDAMSDDADDECDNYYNSSDDDDDNSSPCALTSSSVSHSSVSLSMAS
jgi:hypothetical protein